MAEGNNWFGSWISAAKNKSSEVLEFVKKDLNEFGNVVKNEASNVVSTTGAVLEKTLKLDEPESTVSTMKRTFSSFLGQMNEVLNPSPDDSDTEAILIGEGNETVQLSKLQQAIFILQKDDKTYLEDPEISLRKQFECWLEIIDDQLSEDRTAKHLSNSAILQEKYKTLVPDSVSPSLFWKRYLFKKALLEDDMARNEAMERREAKEKQMTEDSVKWDQEEFANDIELTEEEQIKLLEQYELETKQKQVTKSPAKEKKKKKEATALEMTTKDDSKNTAAAATTTPTTKQDEITQNLDNSSSSASTDDDWEKVSDPEK